MGLFDYVECAHPAFICSEGHSLQDAEFQTKDLGCTMGSAVIDDRLTVHDGGWGDSIARPFTGTIEVYAECKSCPAFVQAETFNLHPTSVDFNVEIVEDRVVSVTRTSKTTAEQTAEAPELDYMPNCRGPFDYETARERHIDHAFFPWDPTPTPSDEAKERQRQWSERVAQWRRKP